MSEALEKKYNEIKNKLAYMVSNDDFNKYFTDAHQKVLKYSDLSDVNNINELLPTCPDYRIILTETKKNEGHWCCIMRYINKKNNNRETVEWFDSYSGKPDSELKFIPKFIRIQLGQNENHLSRILKTVTNPLEILYNSTKYQTLKNGVNTCGRWCILRLIMYHIGYSLDEFKDLLVETSTKQNKPFDIIVVEWI